MLGPKACAASVIRQIQDLSSPVRHRERCESGVNLTTWECLPSRDSEPHQWLQIGSCHPLAGPGSEPAGRLAVPRRRGGHSGPSAQGLLRAQAHAWTLQSCMVMSHLRAYRPPCADTSLDGEYLTTRIAQMLRSTPPSHTPTRPTSPEPENLVCGLISIGIIRSFSWSAFLNQCASKRYRSVQEGQLPCKAPYSWGIRKGYIRGAA